MTPVALFGALTILFIGPFISHQYSRYGRFAGWPAIVSASIVLYGCALVAFTLFPLPDLSGDFCARRASIDHWRLDPFTSLDQVSAAGSSSGLLGVLTSGAFLQLVMNFIFFLPLGFYIAYRSRRSLGRAASTALVVSLVIEVTQGSGLWGLAPCPYRVADVDDLILNTAGGIAGWFVGFGARRFLPDPTPRPQPDPGPASAARQVVGELLDVQMYVLIQLALLIAADRLGVVLTPESELLGSLGIAVEEVDFAVITMTITLVLFVVIPRLRGDRASVGFACVHLALVRIPVASTRDWEPAPLGALIVRWLLLWLPVVLFGLVALLIVLPLQAAVMLASRGRRSLSSRLGHTEYVTRESIRGVERSEHSNSAPLA